MDRQVYDDYVKCECPKCGRFRLQTDGYIIVCEKCHWNLCTQKYEKDELHGLIARENVERLDYNRRK